MTKLTMTRITWILNDVQLKIKDPENDIMIILVKIKVNKYCYT